ncbi:DUF6114 domain-containing protein [Actinoplanes subtropicus]|jgi:hypothetical protein|uniref:DUF6114 domain-containing protein n=1 Tax=Actinoplanes subtropicus TaxID=543632 RepID=UPI00146FC9A0|nr:DUF6114 domain-containing protein [Actinoplanes subtropicus]
MARSKFWHWRHARPFWGGLFVFLGGTEIFLTVKAPLPVVMHVGMQGVIGYLLPILLALLGLLMIFSPAQRLFYSLVATVLALASWLTSNLGGFVIGLLLALVGSALTFAWSPSKYPVAPGVPQESPEAPAQPAENDGAQPPGRPDDRETLDFWRGEDEPQEFEETPGVQPETSQSLPRHSRPEPGLLSGE